MSCCPSTWKGRALLSPQADFGPDLWPEGRNAVSSEIELWSLLPWQIRVFISMEPLTCSSPLSPTPPRPGSAPRCSGTGLLPSCRSLFQTESQSGDQLTPVIPPAPTLAAQGQKPLLKRKGHGDTPRRVWSRWCDAMFPFFTSDPVFCSSSSYQKDQEG